MNFRDSTARCRHKDVPVFDRGEIPVDREEAAGVVIDSDEIIISCLGRDFPASSIQVAFERGMQDGANGIHQNPYASAHCFAWLRGYYLAGGVTDRIMPLLPRYQKVTRPQCLEVGLDVRWGTFYWQGENHDNRQNSAFAYGVANLFVGRYPVQGCYRLSSGKTGAANNPDFHWKPQREFIPAKVRPTQPEQTWDDFMQDDEMFIVRIAA